MGKIYKLSDLAHEKENLINKAEKLKAVLFDMDGTVLHSEPLHALAINKLLPPFEWPLHFQGQSFHRGEDVHDFFRGHNDLYVFKVLKEVFEDVLGIQWIEEDTFVSEKNKYLEEKITTEQLKKGFSPEMMEFLQYLKERPLDLALVSASQRPVVHSFSQKLNFDQWFDVILGAEDTERTKPDPMPYLEAMRRLKVAPEETLIFEDSQAGLASALSSGAFVYQALWY